MSEDNLTGQDGGFSLFFFFLHSNQKNKITVFTDSPFKITFLNMFFCFFLSLAVCQTLSDPQYQFNGLKQTIDFFQLNTTQCALSLITKVFYKASTSGRPSTDISNCILVSCRIDACIDPNTPGESNKLQAAQVSGLRRSCILRDISEKLIFFPHHFHISSLAPSKLQCAISVAWVTIRDRFSLPAIPALSDDI